MNHHFTAKRLKHVLKAATVLVLLYILILLSSIFLGTDFKKNASSMAKDTISFLVSSLFCQESATISYATDSRGDIGAKQRMMESFFSPVIQYVQASSDSTSGNLLSNEVLIHTQITSPSASKPTSSIPLEASEELELDTNESLDTYDNVYFEDEYDATTAVAPAELSGSEKQTLQANKTLIKNLTTSLDREYLIEKFYKVNPSCVIDKTTWNVKKLLSKDVSIQKDDSKPQILIFHTHAHETFADSRNGVKSDSIVGVGEELATILKEKYGYNVMHYSKQYNYNTAYNEALTDLTRILKENPSIQVVIDMHRDGVADTCNTHSVVNVGNEQMAPIMFFNGVSNNKKSSLNFHKNKNLQANLAFSLQLKLYAMQTYPQFTKKNFLKSFRYNMHVVERYSLVEVGDNNNTVAEAKAAMTPLAQLLDHVLSTPNSY